MNPAPLTAASSASPLPGWAADIVALYESHAINQFILHGNVNDRMLSELSGQPLLGGVNDFLLRALLPGFQVILTFDLGNGIRIEKGGEILSDWVGLKENADLPKAPRAAVELLTRYFRYSANLARLGKNAVRIACIIKAAHLIVPAVPGSINYDLNSIALLMREWSADDLLVSSPLATFLVTDNLNDLHPLLVNNPRAATVLLPQPTVGDLRAVLDHLVPTHPVALEEFKSDTAGLAAQLAGATSSAVENLIQLKEYKKEKLRAADLVQLKKRLVEKDCNDLVEFIESRRTLDDVHAQEKLKTWLRQDMALWRQGDLKALPMGYLICGPVGTGKTYLVECVAGEAGIPVVKIKNFRDKWVGSTEGNLEKIFRLLQALGRCFVFIDEADQALGKRDSGGNDAGLSGRIYSMIAKEMSNSDNRGRIIWVLASSRPDLIEVDLKRPGRVDVKIPIFPTTSAAEGFELLKALCQRRGLVLESSLFAGLEPKIPLLLTPGAAEALAVKIYRTVQLQKLTPAEAVGLALKDYQSPVAKEVMDFQIGLAVNESTDWEFVPEPLRHFRNPA